MVLPYGSAQHMNSQFAELLREVEEHARQHGEVPNMAREAGQFLNVIAKATGAQHILEVGVGDGYGTLWLAEAAAANDGLMTVLESDVWRVEVLRELLDRSPYGGEKLHLMQGEILELLPVLEGPFDFVMFDGDQTMALHYLRQVVDQITSGGMICCDKAISRAAPLAEYLSYVHDSPGLESVLVPIGEGIEITYKIP